ncbi:MAG TPA: WYL domain-containing protein [Jiangellales bacterium]|nr:WYL domain-containing protein [Jiangellales bacterium]
MADTATRLLRLLALLSTRPQWTGAALSEALGVSPRTVRADVERLRSLEYRIDATPGAGGGYRLRAGTSLPPLPFDGTEAVAIAVALQTVSSAGVAGIDEDAHRAAVKLEQLLPARLRHRLATLTAALDSVPASRDPISPDLLATVAEAIDRCDLLRFDYLDRHRGESQRQVEPHRLLQVGGRWYLVAFDLDRDDWRSYRLDRITPRTPPGPRFTPREFPGPDLATWVVRGRMAALWSYRASIVVDAPAETVLRRIPTSIWAVEALGADTSALHAGAQTPELLASYLAALDLDFHIDPDAAPDLAAALQTLAVRCVGAVR